MKKITLFLSIVTLFVVACKKDNSNYKVTYSVTGNTVEQYKITNNTTDTYVLTPITGTKDTTVYYPAGTLVKLDVKANSATTNILVGTIYVNDEIKATLTDSDIDADGKTQVKMQYALPK